MVTSDGLFRAIVPSGASTGIYEACELRDGGGRFMGKGVLKAVEAVNTVIAPALVGKDPTDQRGIDDVMLGLDGTDNKTNLGANAILAVSTAAAHAGAGAKQIPLFRHIAELAGNPDPTMLPVPCFNVINGGEHAGNKLAFQEFFIIPSGASNFKESMQIGCEVFHNLKAVIKGKFGGDATLIGDEGGFAPPCTVESGLEMLMEATEKAGYLDKVEVGMDVASSEFKVDGENAYDLDFKTSTGKDASLMLSGDELLNFYSSMCKKFPIVTIEDAFDQDDWTNWSNITNKMGDSCQIVGDDLTVTNPVKIKQAIETNAANCLLLKINQIGSISESIDAVKLAKQNGWGIMTSHRSGESEDTTIADIAVGLCTGQIKTGAPCRGERTAKYNQLLRIEEMLGDEAKYPANWAAARKPQWMA
jgi:enolase